MRYAHHHHYTHAYIIIVTGEVINCGQGGGASWILWGGVVGAKLQLQYLLVGGCHNFMEVFTCSIVLNTASIALFYMSE